MKTSDQFSIPEQSLFMVQKLVTGLISNPWMNSVLLTIAKVQASATLILGRTFLWCGLFCTVPSVSKGFYRCTRSYLWVFRAELPSANVSDALYQWNVN